MENELEYAREEDDSGNGDDIDNEAPPVLMPNYPRLSFDNIMSWFDVVETAFCDLNITHDRSSLEILFDSFDIGVNAPIDDDFHSA